MAQIERTHEAIAAASPGDDWVILADGTRHVITQGDVDASAQILGPQRTNELRAENAQPTIQHEQPIETPPALAQEEALLNEPLPPNQNRQDLINAGVNLGTDIIAARQRDNQGESGARLREQAIQDAAARQAGQIAEAERAGVMAARPEEIQAARDINLAQQTAAQAAQQQLGGAAGAGAAALAGQMAATQAGIAATPGAIQEARARRDRFEQEEIQRRNLAATTQQSIRQQQQQNQRAQEQFRQMLERDRAARNIQVGAGRAAEAENRPENQEVEEPQGGVLPDGTPTVGQSAQGSLENSQEEVATTVTPPQPDQEATLDRVAQAIGNNQVQNVMAEALSLIQDPTQQQNFQSWINWITANFGNSQRVAASRQAGITNPFGGTPENRRRLLEQAMAGELQPPPATSDYRLKTMVKQQFLKKRK